MSYLKSVALYSGDSISKGREIANIFGDTSIQNWFKKNQREGLKEQNNVPQNLPL